MGKPMITIDSKRMVLDVNQITLTVEQLTVAMNGVYEASHSRVNGFHWYELYSVAFSVAATLFLTCLTATFKDFSSEIPWLNSGRMTFSAWMILFLLFVFGMICVCRKSNANNDVFVDRNNTVIAEINKLLIKKEKVAQ